MARKKVQRSTERKRASTIRKKILAGTATDEQRAWLEHYDANKQPSGRPVKHVEVDEGEADDDEGEADTEADDADDPAGERDQVDTVVEVGEATRAAPAGEPPRETPVASEVVPPPMPPPRLGRPPRVRADVRDDDRKTDGRRERWQDKYKTAGKADGREATVTKIADMWCGALQAMADQMSEIGVKPIVDPESMRSSIVLVVDDVLPAHVELTPKHLAVGGTTALVVQRFMRRKEIAEHQKKEADRADYAKRNQERREATERAQAETAARSESPPADVRVDPGPPATSTEPDPGGVDSPGFAPVASPANGVNGANGAAYHGLSAREILATDPTAVM